MSRPSDHEFETEFGGGLEAWHPDCAGLAWARLYAEAQRARAGEEAAEAKLREAEARIAAHEAAAAQNIVNEVLLEERAEKAERDLEERTEELAATSAVVLEVRKDRETAERERDEAREALRHVVALFSYSDGMGCFVVPGNVRVIPVLGAARAALGEKP